MFSRVAVELHDAAGLDGRIELALAAAQRLVACDSAGIVLIQRRTALRTAAATDPLVEMADQLQTQYDDGPCRRGKLAQGPVLIRDCAAEQRYPRWAPQVAALGLRSVLSVALSTRQSMTIGALNLYATTPDRFTIQDQTMAGLVGSYCSIALAAALQVSTLRQAIDSRTVIGQAQGLLMERFGIGAGQAFAVLRRYSQTRNVKLHTVAQQLVETRKLPGEDTSAR